MGSCAFADIGKTLSGFNLSLLYICTYKKFLASVIFTWNKDISWHQYLGIDECNNRFRAINSKE